VAPRRRTAAGLDPLAPRLVAALGPVEIVLGVGLATALLTGAAGAGRLVPLAFATVLYGAFTWHLRSVASQRAGAPCLCLPRLSRTTNAAAAARAGVFCAANAVSLVLPVTARPSLVLLLVGAAAVVAFEGYGRAVAVGPRVIGGVS
jgi:hypothetical protein